MGATCRGTIPTNVVSVFTLAEREERDNMQRRFKIFCDGCSKDITHTGPQPQYRLHLSAEKLSHLSENIYDININPPIIEDHHFCSLECMGKWLVTILGKEDD